MLHSAGGQPDSTQDRWRMDSLHRDGGDCALSGVVAAAIVRPLTLLATTNSNQESTTLSATLDGYLLKSYPSER